MLQEAFQFQKDLCESTFSIATSMQENCENMLKDSLDLNPWLPLEGKKVCLFFSEQYWSTLANMKSSSLLSLDYVENLFTPPESQAKVSPPAAKTSMEKTKPTTRKTTATKSTRAKKTTTTPVSAKKSTPAKKTATGKSTPRQSQAVKSQGAKKSVSTKAPAKKPTSSSATAKKSGGTETKAT